MITYTYKLKPKAKRDGYLGDLIDRHNMLWNKFVWLEEVSKKRLHKHISGKVLNKYVNLHKKGHGWDYIIKGMDAQSIQAAIERRDIAFEKFFAFMTAKKEHRPITRVQSPPRYKSIKGEGSFTLKQSGWKMSKGSVSIGRGRSKWGPQEFHHYGYFDSRGIEGKIKAITIRREKSGDMTLFVTSDHTPMSPLAKTGVARGFDFGSTHFFVDDTGHRWDAPQVLKKYFAELLKLDQRISRCVPNSGNQRRLYEERRRLHKYIVNVRNDWQWKMAWEMCKRFDILCFERINFSEKRKRNKNQEKKLSANQKRTLRKWRRKLLDYAPAAFLEKVQWIAKKTGKTVLFCDRWDATSQKCHVCKHINQDVKNLDIRKWKCPYCGTEHDRDINAAKNVLQDCLEANEKKIYKGTERCAGGASSVDVGQNGTPVRESRWARIRKSSKSQGGDAGLAEGDLHGTQTYEGSLAEGIQQTSIVRGCQEGGENPKTSHLSGTQPVCGVLPPLIVKSSGGAGLQEHHHSASVWRLVEPLLPEAPDLSEL